jgi:hypothetical protein
LSILEWTQTLVSSRIQGLRVDFSGFGENIEALASPHRMLPEFDALACVEAEKEDWHISEGIDKIRHG